MARRHALPVQECAIRRAEILDGPAPAVLDESGPDADRPTHCRSGSACRQLADVDDERVEVTDTHRLPFPHERQFRHVQQLLCAKGNTAWLEARDASFRRPATRSANDAPVRSCESEERPTESTSCNSCDDSAARKSAKRQSRDSNAHGRAGTGSRVLPGIPRGSRRTNRPQALNDPTLLTHDVAASAGEP